MALDATEVRVAADTHIFMAPLGTVFPDWDDTPAAAWIDIGFVTPDGVDWKFNREVNEIYAMQAAEPVRVVNTKLPKSIGFALMQSGRTQFELAMGGGTWTLVSGETDVYQYEPPTIGVVDEKACLVEMVDGTNTYRWHIKRCQNKEGVEMKYVRDDAATFPVTLAILPPADNSATFYLTSDDPALAP